MVKKNTAAVIIIFDFSLYYRTLVIKQCSAGINRHILQWDIIKDPYISTVNRNYLMFVTDAKKETKQQQKIIWRKDNAYTNVLEKLDLNKYKNETRFFLHLSGNPTPNRWQTSVHYLMIWSRERIGSEVPFSLHGCTGKYFLNRTSTDQ